VSGSATSSRARTLGPHAVGAAVVALATARLHATGGYAVVPGDLLTCPLRAATGLWCPFCGGLRCVAALAHGDLAAAASFNVAVLVLLPVVAGWWLVAAWSAAQGRPNPLPRVDDRGWLVVLVVLAGFTVWRNVPGLPLAGYLAP
jgi:hypothetical protein